MAHTIKALIGRMSLAEKIGQMTQAERKFISPEETRRYAVGSILNGGGSVPQANTPEAWRTMIDGFQSAALASRIGVPLLYGTDAVHGHNNLIGATLFPHNIALGATRNAELTGDIARATAVEVAQTGVHWNFAPALSVVRDCRWGRSYESFSAQPDVVTAMGGTYVRKMQRDNWVMATAKHWVGDGGTRYGTGDNGYHIDRGNALASKDELTSIHIAPYISAIEQEVGAVMLSYNRVNGVKMHEHRDLNNKVLKGTLGFAGFTVSDWQAIAEVSGKNQTQRIANAVNAGLDMAMEPEDWKGFIARLTEAVTTGLVSEKRIDDAVFRILTQKSRFRLFSSPFSHQRMPDAPHEIGHASHRTLARQAVRESQVILKNDNILPIKPGTKVFVTGSHADDIGLQCGGWSVSWQGSQGRTTQGTSILEGLREYASDLIVGNAIEAAKGCDLAIVVTGEQPYAEGYGDMAISSQTFHQSATLPQAQKQLIRDLNALGIPVCMVLVTGRPLIITDDIQRCSAVVVSWLPGTEGLGVADVLFGLSPASGVLPVPWPKTFESYPDQEAGQLFKVGHGLND